MSLFTQHGKQQKELDYVGEQIKYALKQTHFNRTVIRHHVEFLLDWALMVVLKDVSDE